jgi:hypothetical protein
MTLHDWKMELDEVLAGTDWDGEWPTVEQNTTTCFADATHGVTKEFRSLVLSYAVFTTKDATLISAGVLESGITKRP